MKKKSAVNWHAIHRGMQQRRKCFHGKFVQSFALCSLETFTERQNKWGKLVYSSLFCSLKVQKVKRDGDEVTLLGCFLEIQCCLKPFRNLRFGNQLNTVRKMYITKMYIFCNWGGTLKSSFMYLYITHWNVVPFREQYYTRRTYCVHTWEQFFTSLIYCEMHIYSLLSKATNKWGIL